MSFFKNNTNVSVQPVTRLVKGGPSIEPTPFHIYVTAINDQNKTAGVRVSRFSSVFKSFNINDRLLVLGLDLIHTVAYGNKIWLEVFYDANLNPVFGMVKIGNKWPATVANPESSSVQIPVYPNQHEFITKYDISSKVTDIDAAIATVNTYQEATNDELLYRKNVNILTEEQYQASITSANEQYSSIRDTITSYKNNMNNFFSGAPEALWRKLFRTYSLIAYTTHLIHQDQEGTVVTPQPFAEPTPDVPKASPQVPFKIVQCLSSDLMLADMCYQSRYPAKIAIPYHSPVYPYFEGGKSEETTNTAS